MPKNRDPFHFTPVMAKAAWRRLLMSSCTNWVNQRAFSRYRVLGIAIVKTERPSRRS